MFKDPEFKPLIESAGHIYNSTFIPSYFLIDSGSKIEGN